MTEELTQYKKEVMEALEAHLKTKGYPNMQPQQILNELPNLWRVMDEKGLIRYGLTYQAFSTIAHQRFVQFQMEEQFYNFFGG